MLKNTLHGVFSVYKPKGWTSRKATDYVQLALSKELLKEENKWIKKKDLIKIGHGGTLDPLAEGVLVLGVGSGCKELSKYLACSKEYIVEAKLGQSTDTYDVEGKKVAEGRIDHLTTKLIEETLYSFKGKITQVPPIYSALRMNGKRLYEYARENKELPEAIKPRSVTIKEIELLEFKKDSCLIRVECGGGTYMRSLVHDMGITMGTYGHMTGLQRTKQGVFRVQDTLDLNEESLCLQLPSELLLQIFQFVSNSQDLYHCALQCRFWSYCALQLLWQRPVIVRVETWMKIANTLSKRDSYINYGAAIQRINLSAISEYINDDSLAVLSICEHLDRVTLAGCDNITDQGFSYFCKHAGRYLSCIDLSEMTHVTDESLFTIASMCPSLQGLNISLTKETDKDTVTDKSIMKIAQHCKKLKRIRFTNRNSITDKSILAFTQHCPSIIELDATHCSITNDSLQSILSSFADLRELKLNNCIHINDHGFLHSSVANYHQLRLLDLTGVVQLTDRTVQWITTVAPKLRSLILNKCENITDRGVQSIARLGKHLHFIHLGSCKNITDYAIHYLVKHCSRIRYIDLTSCALITDQSVAALATLTKLKRIGLVRCELITNRSIAALTHACSTLERAHLSHCRNLTVQALSRFVLRCKHLNHLSLSFIPAFQLSEFQQFSREPPKDYLADSRSFCVISGYDIHKLRACIRAIKFADMVLNTPTSNDEALRITSE